MIVYRAKGKLKARSGLGFLQKKTSFSKTGFNKNKNLNYIFTISELNKFSYANKKRNQIKTFKSKNSGTKFFSDKSDFKRKKQKFSSKKNFKTGNFHEHGTWEHRIQDKIDSLMGRGHDKHGPAELEYWPLSWVQAPNG